MGTIHHYSEGPQNNFSRGPHWNHESPFLPVDWETTQELGAPSLKHAAMKAVLYDQSELKPEMFEHVPWLIAEYLWRCLEKCNKRTLYTWKLMTTRYPEFRARHPSYYLEFADGLDFLAIADIKNLVALQICSHHESGRDGSGIWSSRPTDTPGLQDGIVMSWIEMAETQGSFQHLRVFRLEGQQKLTPNVLPMLRKLPQLQYVVFRGCDLISKELRQLQKKEGQNVAEIDGWIVRRGDWIIDQDGPEKAKEAEGWIRNIYEGTAGPDFENFTGMEAIKPYSLGLHIPSLEFDLGGEFGWSFQTPPWESFWLARAPCASPPPERKRAPENMGKSGTQKRVMKDRGQDLSGMLGQFM
ncbi:hypothetical protein N7454_001926 [Penicillium verhagenii]|nr:hypothetical protein N7454_001926 [Penicillium verhagenii]